MNNNRMQYYIDNISSIKGKKTTPASGNYKASGANITFRAAFLQSEYDEDLGFNVDKENSIEFKINCEDHEVSKLGSLLEAIKKIQASGKKIELILDGSLPSYGDYKTVYSVILDVTAKDFIKQYESSLKG